MSNFYSAEPSEMTTELQKKYASLWAQVNWFKIPDDFRHMEEPKEEDPILSSHPIKKHTLEKAFKQVERDSANLNRKYLDEQTRLYQRATKKICTILE